MNTLDYRCNDDNGLSFELLVDGQPLGHLVGAKDTAIPYRVIEDDLPYEDSSERHKGIRIICVCSCGETGCGHTACHVVLHGDEVIFHDFTFDVTSEGAKKEFHFTRSNYDAVVAEIVARAREQRAKT